METAVGNDSPHWPRGNSSLFGFVEVASEGSVRAGSIALGVGPGKCRFSLPLVAIRLTFRSRLYLASIHLLLSDYQDTPHSSRGGTKRSTGLNAPGEELLSGARNQESVAGLDVILWRRQIFAQEDLDWSKLIYPVRR